MKVVVKAAWDGKKHISLLDDADLNLYQKVDTFEFEMKDSGVFSIAEADAVVTAMPSTKQLDGSRSSRAEERMFPLAFVKVHLIRLTKNGEEIKPVTIQTLGDIGFGAINIVYNKCAEPGPDFLKPLDPPAIVKGGEKGTASS